MASWGGGRGLAQGLAQSKREGRRGACWQVGRYGYGWLLWSSDCGPDCYSKRSRTLHHARMWAKAHSWLWRHLRRGPAFQSVRRAPWTEVVHPTVLSHNQLGRWCNPPACFGASPGVGSGRRTRGGQRGGQAHAGGGDLHDDIGRALRGSTTRSRAPVAPRARNGRRTWGATGGRGAGSSHECGASAHVHPCTDYALTPMCPSMPLGAVCTQPTTRAHIVGRRMQHWRSYCGVRQDAHASHAGAEGGRVVGTTDACTHARRPSGGSSQLEGRTSDEGRCATQEAKPCRSARCPVHADGAHQPPASFALLEEE